jgi:hypothetical protein
MFVSRTMPAAEPVTNRRSGTARCFVSSRSPRTPLHVIKVFAVPVHAGLQVEAGIDRAVELLIIRARVAHLPHPRTVHHRRLRYFGQYLFFELPFDDKIQRYTLSSFNDER